MIEVVYRVTHNDSVGYASSLKEAEEMEKEFVNRYGSEKFEAKRELPKIHIVDHFDLLTTKIEHPEKVKALNEEIGKFLRDRAYTAHLGELSHKDREYE